LIFSIFSFLWLLRGCAWAWGTPKNHLTFLDHLERKISHKSFIDKTKSIMTREEKMKENEQKILLMCSDPKLPEVEDKLPDFGTLFKNENVD